MYSKVLAAALCFLEMFKSSVAEKIMAINGILLGVAFSHFLRYFLWKEKMVASEHLLSRLSLEK